MLHHEVQLKLGMNQGGKLIRFGWDTIPVYSDQE